MARILVASIALSGVAAAQSANVDGLKPAARAHLQNGLKLYEQQRYPEAIAELRQGLAIDPQPDILYALGQAERKRGDCAHAVEYYRSCLALVKDPAAAAAIKVQIERCEVSSGAEPRRPSEAESSPTEAAATKAPATEAATLAPATVAQPAPRRAWQRDPLAGAAVALGLGGVVAGGVLVGLSKARLDVAGDSYQHYSDARGWPNVWVGGIVSLAAGGTLLALGVVRYAVVAKRARRSQ